MQAYSSTTFLGWVQAVFIPRIFVGKWYNGKLPTKNEDGLISDRASFLVGMARLRQLRLPKGEAYFDRKYL